MNMIGQLVAEQLKNEPMMVKHKWSSWCQHDFSAGKEIAKLNVPFFFFFTNILEHHNLNVNLLNHLMNWILKVAIN